jgi:hypothetical protein
MADERGRPIRLDESVALMPAQGAPANTQQRAPVLEPCPACAAYHGGVNAKLRCLEYQLAVTRAATLSAWGIACKP